MAAATGNALNLWAAYKTLREAELPLPLILFQYLDEVCDALLRPMGKSKGKSATTIARALMMSRRGRGTVFTTYDDRVARIVERELSSARRRGDPPHVAVAKAAQQAGVSKRTARRYRQIVERADEALDEFILPEHQNLRHRR